MREVLSDLSVSRIIGIVRLTCLEFSLAHEMVVISVNKLRLDPWVEVEIVVNAPDKLAEH